MSFVADLYQLGYAPLQHHDRAFDIDYRIVRYAVRLDRFDDDLRPEVEDGDAGDVLGAVLWRAAPPEAEQTAPARPISGWWYAAPSVVHRAEGAVTRDATIARDLPAPDSGLDVRPIRDAEGAADLRFEPMAPNYPAWAHRLPKGWQGSVSSASEEYAQIPTLLPAALGLVAANHAGDPIHSTPVLDLDDEQQPDPERRALLHSAWRVVLPEPSDVAPLRGPSLAWQLGRGGPQRLTSGYGLCWDEGSAPVSEPDETEAPDETRGTTVARNPAGEAGPSASTVPRDGGGEDAPAQATGGVVGAASARVSGPLDVGSSSCPHRLGVTKDSEPINALHLSTSALWISSGGDAPLDITDEPEPEVQRVGGIPARVLCRIDSRASHTWIGGGLPTLRRWSVNIPVYDSPPLTPPTPPTPQPPGPTPRRPHPPRQPPTTPLPPTPLPPTPPPTPPEQPSGRKGFLVPGSLWGDPQKRRVVEAPLAGTPRDWSVPALTFRSMPYCDPNSYDTRYWDGEWSPEYLDKWRASPVVARVEAFGAELCGGEWDYDSEGESPRWRDARTAAGSLAVLPGGVGLEDVPDLDTPGRTLGTAYLGVVTGASRFAAGVPIYSGTGAGGYGSGWDWGTDSSGDLVFRSLSSTGVATTRMTLSGGVVHAARVADADGDTYVTVDADPATDVDLAEIVAGGTLVSRYGSQGGSAGAVWFNIVRLTDDMADTGQSIAMSGSDAFISFNNYGELRWNSGSDPTASGDLRLLRAGAGILSIGDSSGDAIQLDASGATADRAQVLPDRAGTFAHVDHVASAVTLAAPTSGNSHTGDTSETTIHTTTLAAARLVAGTEIAFRGVIRRTGTAGDITVKVKLDGVTLHEAVIASGGPLGATFEGWAQVETAGAGGTFSAPLFYLTEDGTVNGDIQLAAAIDTTGSVDLVVTGQLANGADTVELASISVKVTSGAE